MNLCSYQFIAKAKGAGKNATTPCDAADIFSPESLNRSGKTPFCFKYRNKIIWQNMRR